MILEIYATRNKKSGQFGKLDLQPFDEKVAIENYSVAYLEATEESKLLLKELDLYHLGHYDTETGIIDKVDPVLLLDLGAVTYGGKKDDKQSFCFSRNLRY